LCRSCGDEQRRRQHRNAGWESKLSLVSHDHLLQRAWKRLNHSTATHDSQESAAQAVTAPIAQSFYPEMGRLAHGGGQNIFSMMLGLRPSNGRSVQRGSATSRRRSKEMRMSLILLIIVLFLLFGGGGYYGYNRGYYGGRGFGGGLGLIVLLLVLFLLFGGGFRNGF